MTDPGRILLVAPRRIGDVLLTTPLLASVHAAWPRARIDALVFAGTGSVLAGLPGLDTVLEVAERPTWRAHLGLLSRIGARYDLALSAVPSDRSTLYARLAARRAAGVVAPGQSQAWKRWLLGRAIDFDDLGTHTVDQMLRIADALGVARVPRVHVPRAELPAPLVAELGDAPLAVLHPWPRYRYKQWPAEAQLVLARWLIGEGLRPVLTGSAAPAERDFVASLARRMPAGALNLCGRLSFAQLGTLLGRASLYVGPDTVTTHLAAASGTPTIALFGPSNPVKWGPWPAGWTQAGSPWTRTGSGRRGNVFLVQGMATCATGVPCLAEGCDRHLDSVSRCLEDLPPGRVIAAATELLARGGPAN